MSSASPNRRSAADLQKILDSLIGDDPFILTGALPDVIAAYERKHDLIILEADEHEGLRTICQQHPDIELGSAHLYQFLTSVPKPNRIRSPSPTPSPSSATPILSHGAHSTPQNQLPKSRRRQSDRIRSPSDSSSSSSENEKPPSRPASRQAFPSSSSQSSLSGRPLPPGRKKTLSDSSRIDTPLSARIRGGVPPSAFGLSGGFARPSPAGRRRRGSASSQVGSGYADDLKSPDFPPSGFGRSFSSNSIGNASPVWRGDDRPESPISPIDRTSYFRGDVRAKSPDAEGEDEVDRAEQVILAEDRGGADEAEADGEELDEVDMEGMVGLGNDSLNPRLSRISTESTTSLRTSHDKLRALQKVNTELGRKLKESEKQLGIIGAENERLVEDLQEKLEEARAEIAQRRKDEKDLKGRERQLTIQVSGFEADIAGLQRTLENSKANYANMQKMYNSQCDEAGRLRELLRDREDEIEHLKDASQVHEADDERFSREVAALESEIKRLESDLSIARQAESVLEVQKQENLALKETIDRMRFDLDEARQAAAGAAAGHQRGSTSASSAGGTMSRNLGEEIGRRLNAAEASADGGQGEEEEGESVVETIVTTQRRRKIGGRSPRASRGAEEGPAGPIIRIEEEIKEYCDVATLTDPIPEVASSRTSAGDNDTQSEAGPSSDKPPAYTAKPEPLDAQAVLDHAHPRSPHAHPGDVEEDYEALVDGLGLRCHVLEEEIKSQQEEREKLGLRLPETFSARRMRRLGGGSSRGKAGIVNYIFYNTESPQAQVGKFAVWTVMVFAIGLAAGSHLISGPPGMHPRDYHLFSQMNSLASAAGVGEGFLPAGSRSILSVVGTGAGLVAGRVPV